MIKIFQKKMIYQKISKIINKIYKIKINKQKIKLNNKSKTCNKIQIKFNYQINLNYFQKIKFKEFTEIQTT